MNSPEYITVSLLNQYLNRKFEYDPYLHHVFLSGEISNFRERPNSHQYFSLKDEHSKIKVVMFKSAYQKLKFRPEEGMKVLVRGKVTLYQPSGEYQINIDKMEPDGVGSLYQAYEQLKGKLAAEGLFDLPTRALPHFPQRIAVITSRSGAVIRDIITTANRRYPQAEIVLYPAVVQGDQAKYSLVDALKRVQRDVANYDVLIIGRGGGSIEDLWPFNEEVVVRQIAEMKLPVISSVGHETDTTLSDLVADYRAATPTAAAELATPKLVDELVSLKKQQQLLFSRINVVLRLKREGLERVNSNIVLTQPNRLFDQRTQQVDLLQQRLLKAITKRNSDLAHRTVLLKERLNKRLLQQNIANLTNQNTFLLQSLFAKMKAVLNNKKNGLCLAANKLDAISPLKIIGRGYVLANKGDRTIISVAQVKQNDLLELNFKDGIVTAEAIKIEERRNE